MTWGDYLADLWSAIKFFGWAGSCMVNALIGGEPFESLSARIGGSILRDGLASRVPMPAWLRRHFEKARRDFIKGQTTWLLHR